MLLLFAAPNVTSDDIGAGSMDSKAENKCFQVAFSRWYEREQIRRPHVYFAKSLSLFSLHENEIHFSTQILKLHSALINNSVQNESSSWM